MADAVLTITISGLATIFSVIIGCYVLLKDPKKTVNEAFALWCFSLSIITIGDTLSTYSMDIWRDPQLALFWSQFTVLGAIFSLPTFLGFCFVLPPKTEGLRIAQYSSLLWAASFLLLLPTGYLVSGVLRFPTHYGVKFGPAILAFAPSFILFLIIGIVVLVRKMRKAGRMAYRSLIFLGIIIAAAVLTTFVPSIQEILYNPSPIGIFSIIVVGVLGNLVLKHHSLTHALERRDAEAHPSLIPEAGCIYLMLEEKPDRCFRIFSALVKSGYYGLVFSRIHPDKIRTEHGLLKTPTRWLSSDEGENVITPNQLFIISHHVRTFCESVEKGVILIQGLEYLVTNTSFEKVLKLVQSLNDVIAKSKASLIITVDSLAITPQELSLLKAEIRHIMT